MDTRSSDTPTADATNDASTMLPADSHALDTDAVTVALTSQ